MGEVVELNAGSYPGLSAAFHRYEAAFNALPEQECEVSKRLELPKGPLRIIGAQPQLNRLKPRLLQELPRVSPELFEELDQLARALLVAVTRFQAPARTPPQGPRWLTEGRALRRRLRADLQALQCRDLLPQDALRRLKTASGYQAVGMDLLILAEMFRGSTPQAQRSTAMTEADCRQAERLANSLFNAEAQRRRAPRNHRRASHQKRAATALFLRKYEEARRAVTYLRWNEDDALDWLPSVYGR